MRVGIYNRWLRTMGGGERDAAAFAQVLGERGEVDFLTHEPIDLADFAARMNLDLPHVRLRLVPDKPYYAGVIEASADYDVFINGSHTDLFKPRGRRNILRVFFPARVPFDFPADDGAAEAAASPSRREPVAVRLGDGFHSPEFHEARPFVWTGARAEVVLEQRRPARAKTLELVLRGSWPASAPAPVKVFIEDRHVASRDVGSDAAWTVWQIALPAEMTGRERLRIRLETPTFQPCDAGASDTRELGVAIAGMRAANGSLLAKLFGSQSADPMSRACHELALRQFREVLGGYDSILAISEFVRRWIRTRWQASSEVVYPAVDTSSLRRGDKRRWILSVGRFFAGSHNKKHLPMIEAFKGLCDGGLLGWEYHLVGGCDETHPEHARYLGEVRAALAGYPIHLHVNAPFARLRDLYAEAAIFWHATGYGEDENADPDNFEHFGITTLEAMASGCVPVVVATAGQLETVVPGESGLLWRDLVELRRDTQRLVEDRTLLERLSAGAIRRAREFDLDGFATRVRGLLEDKRLAKGSELETEIAFVVGCARSGTSILGELLAAHPRVSYVFEAHDVWEAAYGAKDSHRLLASDATDEIAADIRAALESRRAPGRLLIEKNPRNALRIPFVRALFPRARFIHIVRDGRDVACSMVPGIGGEEWLHLRPPRWREIRDEHSGLIRCAMAWREVVEIALADLAVTPHHQVRYEDLVTEPRRVAAELLRYLGLPQDANVDRFCDKIQDETSNSYHAARQVHWYRDDHQRRIGRWREAATAEPREMEQVQVLLRDTLRRLGYDAS